MADDKTQPTEQDLPASEGGTMHYGGTDAAYDGMDNKNEGDAADNANRVDRTDMTGLDLDPDRVNMEIPKGSDLPRPAPGDNSNV